MQPFVISMIPSNRKAMFCGRSDNNGEKHSITMKKIVIIAPTERVGTKTIADLYLQGKISKEDAFKMTSFLVKNIQSL